MSEKRWVRPAKLRKAAIFKRGDRGFHGYGKPFKDSYGGELAVYESSSAEGPHVWLKIDAPWNKTGHLGAPMPDHHSATAHLNAKQALELIRRLQTWMDEIPKRWKR